jgi:hypothetical protein
MRPGPFFSENLVASRRSGFSAFAGGGSNIDLCKKAFAAIGPAIANAHTILKHHYPLLVEQKRADPGKAEKHFDALIGTLDTLNWVLNHPLDVGGMK